MRSWGSYTNTYWALGTGASIASPRLRTPPNRHLTPSDPLSAPLGQMLALGNQTLMDRTGQHRDAVPHLKGQQACAGTGGFSLGISLVATAPH